MRGCCETGWHEENLLLPVRSLLFPNNRMSLSALLLFYESSLPFFFFIKSHVILFNIYKTS